MFRQDVQKQMLVNPFLVTLRMRKPLLRHTGSLLLLHHVHEGMVFELKEMGFLEVQFPFAFLLDASYVIYLLEA